MLAAIKGQVRYWGFLLVKLAAAAMGSATALWFLNLFWPPHTRLLHLNRYQFMFDLGYTTLVMVWFLLSYGMLYLAFWDQRYRCRTCLRRLCMPVKQARGRTCCGSAAQKWNIFVRSVTEL